MVDIVQNLKKSSIAAVDSTDPTTIRYGTVINQNPLQIRVEQKLTLTEAQLVLMSSVLDYEVEITVDHVTEVAGGHSHDYVGKKKIIIHNGLKQDDRVVMLKQQGGQSYLVIDKVR